VLAPECLEVPRQWLIERDIDRLVELVRDRMRVTLTDAYFDFLFPPRDGIEDPSVEEDVRKEAA
jgi:hypothetical protein